MELEKVIADLTEKFGQPKPEFCKRRILFWLDERGEFADMADDVAIEGVKFLRLTGHNLFEAKRTLFEHTDSDFLVYRPFAYNRAEENWLLNLELCGDIYRSDIVSIWIDEMGLKDVCNISPFVERHKKFFDSKARREKVAMRVTKNNQESVLLAVMAVACGIKECTRSAVLRAAITAGIGKEENAAVAELEKYGLMSKFMELAKLYGYTKDKFDAEDFARYMLLSASLHNLDESVISSFADYYSLAYESFCYDFAKEWMECDREGYAHVAEHIERTLKLAERFEKKEISKLIDCDIFPSISERIILSLISDVQNNLIQPAKIFEVFERRRAFAWFEKNRLYYDCLFFAGKLLEFCEAHANGFHETDARKIWKCYTEDYWRMDNFYRKFRECYGKTIGESSRLSDAIKAVAEVVENRYKNDFLSKLGENFAAAASGDFAKYGHITDIAQQTNFYDDFVNIAPGKVFVVISDALRFEVARDLEQTLREKDKCDVVLESCEAIFPTETKYGMAALLPGTVDAVQTSAGSLSVTVDGKTSDGIANRDVILKAANEKSVALKYEDIADLRREEKRKLVEGMQVVYIYHNKIDKASHAEDAETPKRCADAVEELSKIVGMIENDLNGVYVIVTADHGFLYTDRELAEEEKADKKSFRDSCAEMSERYAVLKKGGMAEFLMPVKFLDGDKFDAFAPRETVRLKTQGAYKKFVHGGVSLQELVVPVLKYKSLRATSREYQSNKEKYDSKPAEIVLYSENRNIYNKLISLNFYQTEAVGGNVKKADYTLRFMDGEEPISDIQHIVADKTGSENKDRQFAVRFTLKSRDYDKKKDYYLCIKQEGGIAEEQKIAFTIDLPFATDDFGFFA